MKRTALKRGKPLQRKTWMRRRRKARLAPCDGPIEADHAGKRPMGRKADDTTCIPLCRGHHLDRTRREGPFAGWGRMKMRAWLDEQIAATQAQRAAKDAA